MSTKASSSIHTSSRTINWPLTGGVHLFAGRVMALSLVDNSARVPVCLTNLRTPLPFVQISHTTCTVETIRPVALMDPLHIAIIGQADYFRLSLSLPRWSNIYKRNRVCTTFTHLDKLSYNFCIKSSVLQAS